MTIRFPAFLRFLALALILAGLGPSPALMSRTASAAPVETEIVGGKKVRQGADPYLVAIQFNTGEGYSQCTGTLLNPTHVLTAAHCVTDGRRAYTEHTVFYGNVKISAARQIAVSVATPHPGYDPNRLRYDVAVLKLSAPVSGPNIGYIKLPAIGSTSQIKTGRAVNVAGWGALNDSGGPVNDLRETSLQIYSYQDCKSLWRVAGLQLTAAHVCAWAPRKDTCFGDSGGPLFIRTATGAVQVGVTSFGYGCATAVPGVYTRLSNPSVGNFVRRMMKA